jgi:hypothetical protein
MKKLFLGLACFISAHSFAQVKFGIEAGYNAASYNLAQVPDADYGNIPASVGTFNAGILSEIPLSKKIFLQPALLYFSNGTVIDGLGDEANYASYSHTSIQVYYLRLPVNMVYKLKLAKGVHFLAGAGLYAARGLSGTGKGNIGGAGSSPQPFAYSYNGKVYFTTAPSSSDETNISPFDAGFSALAGIQWKNFQLTADYSHGFSQVYSKGGFNYKDQAAGISLAYLFSLKR